MQLQAFLENSARRHPHKTGLVCGPQRLTYAAIEANANRLAHGLMAAGLEPGERGAILLDNSVETVVSIFAVLKAGGVFLPINPTTKADKLTFILNNSRAKVLIAPARKSAELKAVTQATPHLSALVLAEDAEAPAPNDQVDVAGFQALMQAHQRHDQPPPKRGINIDLAALIYTSGSTGQPKGVMLTHLNMVSAATSITTYLENRPDDVILNVLPLSFDYGLYQVLMAFQFSGTVILERSFTYPHAVLETAVREKVTGLPLVPTMAAMLLQMDLSKYDCSHVRYLTNTAAALPVAHIQKLRRAFPQARLYSMYGLTECKRVSYLPPEELDRRPDSVGRGMPNEEVYLVDETGRRLPSGSVGELVVRGANVMKGYWELPEETAQRLKPGPLPNEMALHTGDIFRTDEEGFLYFVGRKDDILKSRGEKVSPREVEEVLCRHQAVAEAAVVGVPHPVLGQAIKAVVALKPQAHADGKELQRHCSRHLEDYMVPQMVEIRASLPRTPNGKIDKLSLAREVGS